jgi:hypothetical protein
MAKKTRRRAPKPSRRQPKDPAAERFTNDLLVRGEAAELTPEGKLPLEATHIKRQNPDGSVSVQRARFKTF